MRQALLGEEHVFGAAKPDALGAETDGGQGVTRYVGIGAHTELPCLVGPLHELGEDTAFRIRRHKIALAFNHPPG